MRIGRGLVVRGALFIVGCALLYYSTIMLLFVPSTHREGYFATNRIMYGVMPFLLSAALFTIVGFLSARSTSSGSAVRSIANTFAYAVCAVVLFDIGGLIVAGLIQSK